MTADAFRLALMVVQRTCCRNRLPRDDASDAPGCAFTSAGQLGRTASGSVCDLGRVWRRLPCSDMRQEATD